MDWLNVFEDRGVFIIREAYFRFRKPALLWSMGKDSTVLLWLCRKAFMGRVPFPVIHIDTSRKLPEMYAFRTRLAQALNLDLRVVRNDTALAEGMGPETADCLTCCTALKTEALKQAIAKNGYDALLVGIRRDEHGVRAKERTFSPRDAGFSWDWKAQPAEVWDQFNAAGSAESHVRVHPLLHAT
jgi:sulfate adenylyltransferase subunit 2